MLRTVSWLTVRLGKESHKFAFHSPVGVPMETQKALSAITAHKVENGVMEVKRIANLAEEDGAQTVLSMKPLKSFNKTPGIHLVKPVLLRRPDIGIALVVPVELHTSPRARTVSSDGLLTAPRTPCLPLQPTMNMVLHSMAQLPSPKHLEEECGCPKVVANAGSSQERVTFRATKEIPQLLYSRGPTFALTKILSVLKAHTLISQHPVLTSCNTVSHTTVPDSNLKMPKDLPPAVLG